MQQNDSFHIQQNVKSGGVCGVVSYFLGVFCLASLKSDVVLHLVPKHVLTGHKQFSHFVDLLREASMVPEIGPDLYGLQ